MVEALPYLGALSGIAAVIGAFVVVLKLGVEKTDVKIGSADRVMIGQDRFIEQLEQNVEAAQKRITQLSEDFDRLREQLNEVTDERDRLRRENRDLTERVRHLEERVQELSDR